MQHELRIAAEQTRGIDAQSEIARDAVGRIALDGVSCLTLVPGGFHMGFWLGPSLRLILRSAPEERVSKDGAASRFETRCCAELLTMRPNGAQFPPNSRRPHQPRFGLSGSGAVEETTGSAGGATGCGARGVGACDQAIGAGSRMVERRRGGSAGGASACRD